MPLRIVVADPNKPSLRALSAFLLAQPGFSVVGEATDSKSLLDLVKKEVVDIVLIECELPGKPLPKLIDQIHTFNPPIKVILISSNAENARLALSTGADSFVSKGDQSEWLLAALHRCVGPELEE